MIEKLKSLLRKREPKPIPDVQLLDEQYQTMREQMKEQIKELRDQRMEQIEELDELHTALLEELNG